MTHISPPRLWTLLRTLGLSLALLTIGVIAASDARAQSGDLRELLNRIQRLEADVQALQRTQATGRGTGGGAAGSADIRINDVEDLVRTLTGRVEENEHALRQLRERLERSLTDIDFRLTQLQQRAPETAAAPAAGAGGTAGAATAGRGSANQPQAAANPAAPPALTQTPGPGRAGANTGPAAAPAPAAAAAPNATGGPRQTPEQEYAAAFRLIQSQQIPQAEVAFRRFVEQNGQHRLADNARYWLGETFYVRGEFERAAAAFADAYSVSPRGEKSSDNLLKLGLSLSRINRRDDACTTFGVLLREFPNLPLSQRQRVDQERTRLTCPT